MGKKKHKFTEEERELIHQMKNELSMMGVPREQWSTMIQDGLMAQQKANRFSKRKKSQGPLSGIVKRVQKKIGGNFLKHMSKRHNLEGSFNDLLGDIDAASLEEGLEFMNNLLFGNLPDFKDISDHGTFNESRRGKKRIIIDLDDEDDI